MSRTLGSHLTRDLLWRLSIEAAMDNANAAIVICSIDQDGWPHPAMLSSLDVVARDERHIALAVHASSTTARNLRTHRRMAFILADERGVYYIKGTATLMRASMTAAPELASFVVSVMEMREDDPAAHERARVTSGIRVERVGIDKDRAAAVLSELTAET